MAESSGRVAESALPSLKFFNHSNFNVIGSEIISGSSLPSEPPDIGNWFSSYVYESPALDTEDGIKGIISGGTEWQKDGFISQEIGREKKKKMKLWNHSHKDDSAFAPIKSFSVNENEQTQSPDETEECNSHVTKKGESENLDSKMLKDHGFVPLYDVDCSEELDAEFSLPSEPPDIANWFSSYCYESPSLDTGEQLNDYVSRENESEKVIFTSEEFNRTIEDSPGKHINDASVLLGQDDEHQNQSMNKGDNNLLVIGDNESLAGKAVKNHDLIPFKDKATSCLTNVDSPQNLKTNLSAEVNSLTPTLKKSSCANHKEAEENPHEMNSEENHFKGKALVRGFDHHHEDSTSLRSEKEQARDITTNGFVSTRKKSFTSQNDRSYIKSCEKKKNDTEMRTSLARKPLLERTNIGDEVVVAPAITGKWKCPQRSKPDVGPPMKQQRLERWIHRV